MGRSILSSINLVLQACQNVYRLEEEPEEAGAAAAGEDLCHPSGYNKETASAVSLMT